MTELTELLVQKDDAWSMPDNVHTAIIGASGSGKTGGLLVAIKKALKNRRRGLVITDAEGELTPHVLEYLANPCHGVSDRRVHLLDAKPNSHAFGIGLLDTKTPGDPQSAHDAASRTVAVFESVMSFGAPEYGPRLQKELNLGCSVLALTGRPLVCLPEIFTLSAEQARATLGETFTYQFMRSEWQALNVLGQKNPRAFIDYTDPVLSRSINLFGSPNLRRIFGQRQQYNFDVRQALENRDIIILNLGGLEHKDSVLIGTAFFSKIYHTALELPITNEPVATVICEECSDYLTADTARGLDRLRKRGIFLVLCLQRCAQLSKANDPAATLLSAVLTKDRKSVV